MFKPTVEQEAINEAFLKHKVIKVNAVAGSGKSSTLRMLAQNNNIKSLYICFNKQNAVLATESFPKNTTCKTVHSLAYNVFGKMLAHKITTKDFKYVNRGRTAKEIVNLYNIQDCRINSETVIPQRGVAVLAKSTVDRFQNSIESHILQNHIPKDMLSQAVKDASKADVKTLVDVVLFYAKQLWKDKVDPTSPVKTDHDTYQKLYQLSKPSLDFDVIYLDEAQDSSPVVLDIIANQTCKVVYVGDTYQSIYAFRQAVNAMEKIEAPTFLLSKSFRYGKGIADLAGCIIKNEIEVKGLETIESVVGDFEDSRYSMIFRTNSELLSCAVGLIEAGVSVKCEIDAKKFQSMIYSTHALYKGDTSKIKDDEISLYATWNDMLEDAKENPEIKRLVNIIINHKVYSYTSALDTLIKGDKRNTKHDVLLTTAHKSKGMEWDNVIIGGDFNLDVISKEKGETGYNQQEVNLFYVACTRAIKKLQLPEDFMCWYKDQTSEVVEV